MSPKFHPIPSSANAIVSAVSESAGARAAVRPAASRVTAAVIATGRRPTRSTRRPVSSEGRYIDPMCTPMTKPT